MKRVLVVLALSCVIAAPAAVAQESHATDQTLSTRKADVDRRLDASHPGASAFSTSCSGDVIHPPITINGSIGYTSCLDLLGLYSDFYLITVQAGQTIDVTFSSSAFEPFLYMYLGSGTSMPVDHSQMGRETAHYTFATSGTFKMEASSFWLPTSGQPWSGPYTLVVNLSGGTPPPSTGSCTSDTHTACLLNNRFKVTVRYRGVFDNNSVDTDASVKPVSGFASSNYETAFFYFNSSNNIEMMVKMLDQGNTNSAGKPTIAVLFGSATPLRMELTITDTSPINSSGMNPPKKYVSPFNTQSGITDFTAFLK